MDTSLKYKNLFNILLAAKHQRMEGDVEQIPQGMVDSGEAFSVTPETMNAYLQSASAFDFALKPSSLPSKTDYSTSGFNVKDPTLGKNAILMAAQKSRNKKLPIYSQEENEYLYKDIPEEERGKRSTAVLEHERYHQNEPKLSGRFGNYGFLKKRGLDQSTELMTRESPAMRAEDRYWDGQAESFRRRKMLETAQKARLK